MNLENVKFQFVRNGTSAEKDIEDNVIWVDVGNGMRKGVLDHHGDASERDDSVCAAEMVYRNQSLVLDNITDANKITIVGHILPDFDCVSSAYLALKLAQEGSLNPEVEKLVQYARMADTGRVKPGRSDINNPYSIMTAFAYMPKNAGVSFDERNTNIMKDGFKLLDYCLERIRENPDLTFESPDLIETNSPFHEELELLRNADKEFEKVIVSAEKTNVTLPNKEGEGTKTVPGIFVKDIPENELARDLMSGWLRNEGYVFTSIPLYDNHSFRTDEGNVRNDVTTSRVIISVAPDSGVNLKGLGEKIETAEAVKCEEYGIRRYSKGRTGEISYTNRPGYNSPDPWYDGRGHNYEIIDGPMSGSVLSVDEINNITKEYVNEIATHENNVSKKGITLGKINVANAKNVEKQ